MSRPDHASEILKRVERKSERRSQHDYTRPDPRVFRERTIRLMMPKTLTGSLMGDPPPGYSALDKKCQN